MDSLKPLLAGLDHAVEMERNLMHYYKHSSDDARTRGWEKQMQRNMDRHLHHIGRIELRRSRLEDEANKGHFADFLSSVGKAIQNIAISFPLEMIVENTHPTPDVFRSMEEKLISYYEELAAIADDETRVVIEHAIEDCRANVADLTTVST